MRQQLKDGKKLSELIENFLFYGSKYALNTRKLYRKLLYDFSEYADNREIITVELIETFIIKKRKTCKAQSCNLYINALKSFYKFLHSHYDCPDLGKLLNVEATLPPDQRVLAAAEYPKICRLDETDQVICVKFLCNTGLRATELTGLRPENIANGVLRVIGKRRRNRSIPLNKTALSIVQKYPDFSFVRRKNRLWLWRGCQEIAKLAGIPPFYPHSCRHYFATELFHRGVNMYTISRLLGHADTKVTENVYVHWSEEQIMGVTDVLD